MRSLLPRGLPLGWRGAGVALGAILVASVALDTAVVGKGPTLCAFRLATDRPCPGCGLTRSFTAAGSGDMALSFAHHPFGPLLFVAAALAFLSIVWRAVSGRWPVSYRRVAWLRPAALGFLAVWLGWAAARAIWLAG